jgi:hypothetical protein
MVSIGSTELLIFHYFLLLLQFHILYFVAFLWNMQFNYLNNVFIYIYNFFLLLLTEDFFFIKNVNFGTLFFSS